MSRVSSSGLKSWITQRISAVYIAFFSVFLLLHFIFSPIEHYTDWKQWLSQPWLAVSFYLYIIALLLHSWIGMKDILMDYVPDFRLRLFAMTLVAMGLLSCAIWSSFLLT